jgi:hypothetical protein
MPKVHGRIADLTLEEDKTNKKLGGKSQQIRPWYLKGTLTRKIFREG